MNAYLRLMRFDKPIGILLLLWPTYWALCLAGGFHRPDILVIFTLGTVFMRAAGCIANDIADRRFDGYVTRTHQRPLATGELSLRQALCALFLMLMLSASLLIFLNIQCFYLAVAGCLLSLIYPFFKRFFQTPQLVLGLAFSWGIPMAYASLNQPISIRVIVLMLLTFFWIIAYDTAYAMADREDDISIGIHSSAIFFGRFDTLVIGLLQIAVTLLWIVIGFINQLSLVFYIFLILASLFFIYQQHLLKNRLPKQCFQAFINNQWYGLLMFIGLMVDFGVKFKF